MCIAYRAPTSNEHIARTMNFFYREANAAQQQIEFVGAED
jgi:hypothetical protein